MDTEANEKPVATGAPATGDGARAKENFSPPPTSPAAESEAADGRWWDQLSLAHRALGVILLLIAVGYVIHALAPVLTPFMFGAMLAYLGTPVVGALARRRVPRGAGAVIVILVIVAALAGLVFVVMPLVSTEATRIAAKVPDLLNRVQEQWLPWLNAELGTSFSLDLAELSAFVREHIGAMGGVSGKLLGSLQVGGQAIIGLIVNLTLVPVVMFYVLRDWPDMVAGVDATLPRAMRPTVRDIAREIDAVLSEFLRGQGLVMLALAAYYCVALKLAGLEFALPIGLITGLLVFIPYVGFGLGMTLGMLAALTQFTTPTPILVVAGVFMVGQVLEGFVLVPFLVGDRIGLHPLAVIFALMAFGQLFGFVGVLLALPASAALLVALRVLRREALAERGAGPAPAARG
ncbi:MAG: AI-2E family transporter [Burkholderiales bacterium]|nr:AI-2E family transporter [Pseudomonadota bacterium]MCZ2134380.1 AI-2E family transporter [Burkholderiales bacterium]